MTNYIGDPNTNGTEHYKWQNHNWTISVAARSFSFPYSPLQSWNKPDFYGHISQVHFYKIKVDSARFSGIWSILRLFKEAGQPKLIITSCRISKLLFFTSDYKNLEAHSIPPSSTPSGSKFSCSFLSLFSFLYPFLYFLFQSTRFSRFAQNVAIFCIVISIFEDIYQSAPWGKPYVLSLNFGPCFIHLEDFLNKRSQWQTVKTLTNS